MSEPKDELPFSEEHTEGEESAAPAPGVAPEPSPATSTQLSTAREEATGEPATGLEDVSSPEPVIDSEPDATPETAADAIAAALDARRNDLASATADLEEHRREQRRLKAREARATKALARVDEEAILLRSTRASLSEWVAERSHSFAWKLVSRLDRERTSADQDLSDLRAAASNPIATTIEPPSALQDRFMKKSLTAVGALIAVFVVLTSLKASLPESVSQFAAPVNPLSWPSWVLALVLLALALLLLLQFLITYYRETSQRRHALVQARAYLEYLNQTGIRIREEQHRLESLHRQVPEYLRYLSEVLHRPWITPKLATDDSVVDDSGQADTPEQIVFNTVRPDTESLPSLMRIAEPPPGSGGSEELALVRGAVQRLLRPGWRFDALVRLLKAIEREQSLPDSTLAPNRVDQDPLLREAVLAALEDSDVRLEAGRDQLRLLSQQIQLVVLDAVRPPVKDLASDPLDHLLLDEDLIGGADRRLKEWDDFLAEALGASSNWGSLVFSLDGVSEASAEDNVNILAYGPERLEPLCHESTTLQTFTPSQARPIELSVRVELSTRALGPNQFKVFDRHQESAKTPDSAAVPQAQPSTMDDSVTEVLDDGGGALA